ncbi:DNA polymerase III subunit delta [Leptospira perolatii]|uniref:DNA polymerase III subunit delta n=1 Tax=Leptospira perolatii TaxID=2023191 RepID=UPI001A9C7138|nr:DNA polymerase III subunit delta [Leptospira perolatii]
MVAVKESSGYGNLLDFLHKTKGGIDELPNVLFVVAEDSYEFGIVSDLYREAFKKSGDSFEVVVFVSEPGDLESFQSEVKNMELFAARKLFLIKSGSVFFKPILSKGKSKLQKTPPFASLPDSVKILVHYDHWDVSKEVLALFDKDAKYFLSKKFFASDRKPALTQACKELEVKLEDEAEEEFILKVHPTSGSYIRNLERLKLFLGKKIYNVSDIREVLFQSSEFNATEILDYFFDRDAGRFFKEFSKFRVGKDSLLLFLNLFKDHLDKLRKFKVLNRFYDKVLSEKEQTEILGIQNYSPARKNRFYFLLKKQSNIFSDKDVDDLYSFLIDMNRRIKTGAEKSDTIYYFLRRIEELIRV